MSLIALFGRRVIIGRAAAWNRCCAGSGGGSVVCRSGVGTWRRKAACGRSKSGAIGSSSKTSTIDASSGQSIEHLLRGTDV